MPAFFARIWLKAIQKFLPQAFFASLVVVLELKKKSHAHFGTTIANRIN
jgi:hypothetical protein